VDESILIDISAAVNQSAGIGRYARELTRELIPLLPPGRGRLWYASDGDMSNPHLLEQPPWHSLAATSARLSRRNVDRLTRHDALRRSRFLGSGNPLDSYSPDFTAPPGRRGHVTIHDLAWLSPEAESPPALASYLRPVVDRALRTATTIFTVSNTVRTEILDRFDVSGDRVIVVPNAPASIFYSAERLEPEELATLGIDREFLLFVGTIEPRKNLPLLLQAMIQLPNELMLVIAGGNGARAPEQLAPIQRFDLGSRVVHLGFVPEDMLPRLYASASAVVYPSRYEGFGLPVIEGLATGVPVIASNLPVFHEVGGEEVTYFDPADASSLVYAIESTIGSLIEDTAAQDRRKARAHTFDWHASAQIVARRLQVFR